MPKKRTPGEILARSLKLEQEGVDSEVVSEEIKESGKTMADFFKSHGVRCSCVVEVNGKEVYRSE